MSILEVGEARSETLAYHGFSGGLQRGRETLCGEGASEQRLYKGKEF